MDHPDKPGDDGRAGALLFLRRLDPYSSGSVVNSSG